MCRSLPILFDRSHAFTEIVVVVRSAIGIIKVVVLVLAYMTVPSATCKHKKQGTDEDS